MRSCCKKMPHFWWRRKSKFVISWSLTSHELPGVTSGWKKRNGLLEWTVFYWMLLCSVWKCLPSVCAGKQCKRQAGVHIVQDEFPFRVFKDGLQAAEQREPAPEARGAEKAGSPLHPSDQLITACVPEKLEPDRKHGLQASNSTPKHSPEKQSSTPMHSLERPLYHASPVASTSCETLRKGKEQVTPPPVAVRKTGGGSGDESDTENGFVARRRLTPHRMQFLSPLPGRTTGSLVSSPCTPQNTAVPLLFSSYRLLSAANGDMMSSDSDCESETLPLERLCLRAIDSNSPSKNSGTSSPVSSPRKSPVKSPRRSPRRKAFRTRTLTFSSPTANLPNSVLDPPQRKSPARPSDAEKKVDWLTSYRLSKAETPTASTNGTVPKISPSGSASRKLFPSDTPSISEKHIGKSSMPKRKNSTLVAIESDDAMPQKRIKMGRPGTPGLSGRKTPFPKGRSTSGALKRKTSSAGSQKVPFYIWLTVNPSCCTQLS